ncbi:MAG TPA: polysaccharide deacetylase family protein [Bacillales bacterium]|nr:polysaccharide deacetylase family protein [Bacillales bacterium]
MRKQLLHWTVFLFIFLFAFGTVDNPWATRYLNDLTQQSVSVASKQKPLYNKIKEAAKKYKEPAIDARIDKVWKAIPGYDGLKVDVKASYEKMQKSGVYDKDKLIFREMTPDVHLSDLPPAPIYKGNPDKPMVGLMVNVAWGNEYIPKMLKVMEQEDVHATFFLDGSWVKKNPDLAKMIAEEGHEIGNHAYSHPDLAALPGAAIQREMQKTNTVIRATLDMTPDLFAPPSGSYGPQAVKIASNLGMKTIMWTVDTVDWKKPRPQDMVQRVLQKVHAGSLILMHPTSPAAEGLKSMIHGIRERGYQIGTVSTVISEDRL